MDQLTPAPERSPLWPKVRAAHLQREPECQACGSKVNLNVHHVRPFNLFPALELEPSNLITLCEGSCNCHLCFGHLHHWAAWNPEVREDAAEHRWKVRARSTVATKRPTMETAL